MTENSIYIHNVLNDEITVRSMTVEEQTQRDTEVAVYLARKEAEAQAVEEAAAQRQALLDKLGITEDEARLLLGGN